MRRQLIQLASAPFTSFRLAKFTRVSFANLCLLPLATKQNAKFTEGARKLRSYFNSYVDQSSWYYGKNVGDLQVPNAFDRDIRH